jgi:hypothetical protein
MVGMVLPPNRDGEHDWTSQINQDQYRMRPEQVDPAINAASSACRLSSMGREPDAPVTDSMSSSQRLFTFENATMRELNIPLEFSTGFSFRLYFCLSDFIAASLFQH